MNQLEVNFRINIKFDKIDILTTIYRNTFRFIVLLLHIDFFKNASI